MSYTVQRYMALVWHSESELYDERNLAGVLEHRYSSRSIVPDPRQYIRSRVILDAVRMPLLEFPSTHAFVSYIHDAALAHLDAFKLAGVEHRDISVGNIVFAQNKNGSSTGIVTDWEFSRYIEDDINRACDRTGTLQFKAARLCSPSPPPRTIGDDVESFVLLLLWMAARNNVEAEEELKRQKALVEGHDWLTGILSTALQDESWANDTDGSRKEQTVERPSRVRTIGVDWF
ncbi:hypothetical protein BDZ89DRAFT_1115774 [Hymenopellis radicata]|nr:hypothetical protein BDZ89DRAFT_1115774 [Hymenopellis radicata]